MEKTFKCYINYGCLAAEKHPVFTAGNPQPTATVSDPVIFEIPEEWELGETGAGNVIVTAPWGWDYEPNELFAGRKGNEIEALNTPHFKGYDKEGKYFSIPIKYEEV